MKLRKKPLKYIVLHHAQFDGECNVDIITRWHIEKGFDTCGYNFCVTGSWYDKLTITEAGRPLEFVGAHTWGRNHDSIGICLTGNCDNLEPPEAQLDELAYLVIFLMNKYDIPINNLIAHRDVLFNKLNYKKTCPGKLIDIRSIRKHILKVKYINGRVI